MKKAAEGGEDQYLAMLNYRAAALDCGYSPAELLMNRRLRTRLPDSNDLLPSEKVTSQTSQKKAQYYNVGAKELAPLLSGDSVHVLSNGECRTKGVVEGQSQSPRSYIIETEAEKLLRRNCQHPLHTKEKAPDDTQMTIPELISLIHRSIITPCTPVIFFSNGYHRKGKNV